MIFGACTRTTPFFSRILCCLELDELDTAARKRHLLLNIDQQNTQLQPFIRLKKKLSILNGPNKCMDVSATPTHLLLCKLISCNYLAALQTAFDCVCLVLRWEVFVLVHTVLLGTIHALLKDICLFIVFSTHFFHSLCTVIFSMPKEICVCQKQ